MSSIKALLPAYCKKARRDGEKVRFKILRCIKVDGHQSAWVKISIKEEGDTYTCWDFLCECYFTQRDGEEANEDCQHRRAAARLRRQELRKEYRRRFPAAKPGGGRNLNDDLASVILDLLRKSMAGEFLGHPYYSEITPPGGYVLAATVKGITGVSRKRIEKVTWKLDRAEELYFRCGIVHPPQSSRS